MLTRDALILAIHEAREMVEALEGARRNREFGLTSKADRDEAEALERFADVARHMGRPITEAPDA